MSPKPVKFNRFESGYIEKQPQTEVEPENTLGPQSTLNTDVPPKSPDRLKKIAAKVASLPLKGLEYIAFGGFAIASIPAVIAMGFGEGPKGQKLGFQIGSILTSPLLVPLAVIGLGAGIAASTIKALGTNKEDMGVWLQGHIARRAHELHQKAGDYYGVDFNKIAYRMETAALNNFAKKCVQEDQAMSFDTFKPRAESLALPVNAQLKSAFRKAKVEDFERSFTPKFQKDERDDLSRRFEVYLEISPDEKDILEEMVDLYFKKQIDFI